MAKRKHPVKCFCPSITINLLIHPPSFRLYFSRHRIIFAGGYDNDNDEEEVQEDEEEGRRTCDCNVNSRVSVTLLISKRYLNGLTMYAFLDPFSIRLSDSCHWILSSASYFQSTPSYPTPVTSILVLFSHPYLGLPSDLQVYK